MDIQSRLATPWPEEFDHLEVLSDRCSWFQLVPQLCDDNDLDVTSKMKGVAKKFFSMNIVKVVPLHAYFVCKFLEGLRDECWLQ